MQSSLLWSGRIFLWLINCIWLHHIPHLWHLEQRTSKTFWDNCLHQLVCVEDPPCTTSSLHHSLLWSIWAITWVAHILQIIYWSDFRILFTWMPFSVSKHVSVTALILLRLWQYHLNCCQESRSYVTLSATVTDCNCCCLYSRSVSITGIPE